MGDNKSTFRPNIITAILIYILDMEFGTYGSSYFCIELDSIVVSEESDSLTASTSSSASSSSSSFSTSSSSSSSSSVSVTVSKLLFPASATTVSLTCSSSASSSSSSVSSSPPSDGTPLTPPPRGNNSNVRYSCRCCPPNENLKLLYHRFFRIRL